MTNPSLLHTPLEALLFFQTLRTDGIDSSSFTRASEILKRNEFVNGSDAYSPDRLSPEALEGLYLRLLKDEIKHEKSAALSPAKGQISRKRKVSSPPPLQSIDVATQYQHLLPQLIDRLYARYRDHAVEEIQEDERKFRQLSKELQEIEISGSQSGGAEGPQTQETPTTAAAVQGRDGQDDGATRAEPLEKAKSQIYAGPIGDRKSMRAPDAAQLQKPVRHVDVQASTASTQKTAPGASIQPAVQRYEQPQNAQLPNPTTASQPPIFPSPSPVPVSQRVEAKEQPPAGPKFSAPPLVHPEQAPQAASPASLAPSNTVSSLGPSSSPIEVPTNRTNQAQTPRPTLPSPAQVKTPGAPPQPFHHSPNFNQPQPTSYYEASNNFPQPFPAYPQQPGPPFLPPGQQVHQQPQNQPFVTPNQNFVPNTGHAPPFPPPLQAYPNQQGYYHGYPHSQSPMQAAYSAGVPPSHATRSILPSTPVNRGNKRASALPRLNTAVSSTKWKSDPRATPRDQQKSPTRPERSPYLPSSPSDYSAHIESDLKGQSSDKKTPSKPKGRPPSRPVETPTRGPGRRGGRWAGHSSRGRGGRPSFGASSVAVSGANFRHSRSASATSPADEMSIDGKHVGRRPKSERSQQASSTPGPGVAEDSGSAHKPPLTPATDIHPRPGRRRADTVRGQATETPRLGAKRKRADTLEDSPEVAPALSLPTHPTKPNQIFASRNFSRVAGPLMNDINSHKLASMFAKPITERDAPGYRSLIYAPQDLKSIRAAISHGGKAVAAALAALEDYPAEGEALTSTTATPIGGRASNSVWVERSPDAIPPKGIVNGSQLEKELCRMFANAVMFNPDPRRGFGPQFPMYETYVPSPTGTGTSARRGGLKSRRGGGGASASARMAASEDGDASNADTLQQQQQQQQYHHHSRDLHDDGDSGAFVRDAREMFDGVERSVGDWRAVEREKVVMGEPTFTSTPAFMSTPAPPARKVVSERKDESDADELMADAEGARDDSGRKLRRTTVE